MGTLPALANNFVMTHNRIRGTTPPIIATARQLRQNPTAAEQILWNAVCKRQLNGLKFRFQHPVSAFVVDFYCPQYRLIIELDGSIHDEQVDYDVARTQHLQHLGYRVIRFHNQEVIQNIDSVLQQILDAVLQVGSAP
jgi:very-short-patch-repair endonuclease